MGKLIEKQPAKVEKPKEKSFILIDGQKIPDPKLHQNISFIKSAIRIFACSFGMFGHYEIAFVGLLLAEVVGIGEELV